MTQRIMQTKHSRHQLIPRNPSFVDVVTAKKYLEKAAE